MDWAVLFVAGVLGGILNSVAGGGSFITFPALMFVGVPPIVANATNTFAACAGYLSGAYGFREDIASEKKQIIRIVLGSLLGGACLVVIECLRAAVSWCNSVAAAVCYLAVYLWSSH